MRVAILPAGKNKVVILTQAILAQAGLLHVTNVEVIVQEGAIVLQRPTPPSRYGWADAARKISAQCSDELVLGNFGNQEDAKIIW